MWVIPIIFYLESENIIPELERNQQEDTNGKSSIKKNFMIKVPQCLMNIN